MGLEIDRPVFSIICPCFNQIEFLKDAVNSVLSQGYKSWELIILNDGSTDGSGLLADELARIDSRIRVIHQENQGLSAARNMGMSIANGQYLGFLDADDMYLPGAFDSVLAQFKTTGADLIIGGYRYFKEGGFFHTHLFPQSEVNPEILLTRNQAPPVSHFLKRTIVGQIGSFDPKLKSCEDWDFWIRIAKLGGKIITIPESISVYRYVTHSMSRNAKIMYESLSEVSHRAFSVDSRLPEIALQNIERSVDRAEIQKNHLIRCLGLLIHQGKPLEAAEWYREEFARWNWSLVNKDWQGLSSPLSWRYFLEKEEIHEIFTKVLPDLEILFSRLGYSSDQIKKLTWTIFRSQRFRSNQLRFGKWLGAVFNHFLD